VGQDEYWGMERCVFWPVSFSFLKQPHSYYIRPSPIEYLFHYLVVDARLSVISKLKIASKAALKEQPSVDVESSIAQWVRRTCIQSSNESVQ
jgi:hypothetical protein